MNSIEIQQVPEPSNSKKLVVEFIDIDKQNYYHALFNGQNHFTSASYCYGKSSLYVRNHELFLAICEYDLADLIEHFSIIRIYTETQDGVPVECEVRTFGGETSISVVFSFELPDWKQPWSLYEYFLEYHKELLTYGVYEVSCEIVELDKDTNEPFYDLYNGIGLRRFLTDLKVNFKDVYNKILLDSQTIEATAVSRLSRSNSIERCLEFPPQYQQAGIGILSYFSSYLSQQYPNSSARVKIEQDGTSVRMIVEAEDGTLETIEKALHEYEMILTGQQKPEYYISDGLALLELKSELRIAQTRIETLKDLNGHKDSQIEQLMGLIKMGLSREQSLVIDFKPEISVTNNVTINQDISDIISSICELKAEIKDNDQLESDLSSIENTLTQLESETDPALIRRSPVMPKLKRFLLQVSDKDSDLNTSINSIKSGVSMCQELFGKYNRLAEWCGLPVIPSIFVK